ncbi:tRNA (adenosine(37)-N6)-threonylcarbamoyltransferase complex ATPase subunit type 1 TsaE [Candidatus Uhrbacteria bacterium]|nr:tRNA (adenosine(37)-N6)-threonylcarbamoyltransferase complex ATPase subunit type 1 TsaE [Candidatus Uhrbacteria bacterium]
MRNVTITNGTKRTTFRVTDEEAWSEVADHVASDLKPGDILALSGPLGAGKTTFVQALATALGAVRRPQSPTFALMRSYPVKRGKLARLLHVDAYRIAHPREILALDLDEELADGTTALAVEWPENVEAWMKGKKTIAIGIRPIGPNPL